MKKINYDKVVKLINDTCDSTTKLLCGVFAVLLIVLIITTGKDDNEKEVSTVLIETQVDEVHLSDVVRKEVERQLSKINPVTIEFINATEPIESIDPIIYFDFIPMNESHQTILFHAMKEYHVGKGFALAIMESESTFDINAQTVDANGVTYYGAWQISEVNANKIKEKYNLDITNPEENLVAGCAILSELIEKYAEYGSEYIINAYKGGEGAAREWYEEDYKLPCCDEITSRAMYWDEILKGEDLWN